MRWKDGPELSRDDIGKKLGGTALERQHVRADWIGGCERSGQPLGQQEVVQTIGETSVILSPLMNWRTVGAIMHVDYFGAADVLVLNSWSPGFP